MNGTGGVWVAQRVPRRLLLRRGEPVPDPRYPRERRRHDALAEHLRRQQRRAGGSRRRRARLDGRVRRREFHRPYYSLRRVWRAQSLAAPSLNLPAWVDGPGTRAYPFAIKPDKLSVLDVFTIHRDNTTGDRIRPDEGARSGAVREPQPLRGQRRGRRRQGRQADAAQGRIRAAAEHLPLRVRT